MHLKTLTLRGFKSFASATTLGLEPGITCVVGPNGSGKSNVVDALAWVMGEQGAKSLRGGQMADVIFAGTSGRAPLGRAQVQLTIDNSDGALPIDYTEVTISRTMFRGGGSEYSLNGNPVRLLDIQELLSDTGMGREMHVIVGQGRLDEVLSATPEERRGFIEEAAGVLKHRRRKERTLRKLDSMAEKMVRVQDLTGELRRRLGPLARQAEVARRAGTIQAEVFDARCRLLADSLAELTELVGVSGGESTHLAAACTAAREKLAVGRQELAELEDQALANAPEVQQATQIWSELTETHERLKSDLALAQERSRALAAPIQAAASEEDSTALAVRAQEAEAEENNFATAVLGAQDDLRTAESTRHQAEETDQAAASALAQAERSWADQRERLARLQGNADAAQSRLEAAQADVQRTREYLSDAQQRLVTAQKEAAGISAEPMPAGSAAEEHHQATERRDLARKRVDELSIQERDALAQRATWQARRDALELALLPKDGTAAILDDPTSGIEQALPTQLQVTPGWEKAVAAALGETAGAIIARDQQHARELLERYREQGQLRIISPLSSTARLSLSKPPTETLPTGCYWAAGEVHATAPALAASLRLLLAGTALCPDLAAAAAVIASGQAQLAVTRSGERLGIVTAEGGAGATSVLEIAAAHEEAVARAQAAHEEASTAADALVQARTELDLCIQDANVALRKLREADAAQARIAQENARLRAQVAGAETEVERGEKAVQRATAEVTQCQVGVGQAMELLAQARTGTSELPDLSAAGRHREEAALSARQAREAETKCRLALRTAEEQSDQARKRAQSLQRRAAQAKVDALEAQRRESRRQRKLLRVQRVAEIAELAVAAAETALANATQRRLDLEASRQAASTKVGEVRRQVDELAARLSDLTDASHRAEVAQAELRLRLEQLEMRAQDELGMDPSELITQFGPQNLVPVLGSGEGEEPQAVPYQRAEQERRLARAEKDLAHLGKVNPLALEEHAALQERYQFLTTQLNDLKASRADLLRIIAEVDERVEEVFAAAFTDTAAAFDSVFTRLFPGGEGRLVLTNPDDLLTSGIEIEARPAGKKVKRLSLLSGGERALAAVALLVAIFQARPSPFYVMDEVEAALDDTNLSRLLDIFQELRANSQLIVVTHQKRTMEIADALYGVTMHQGVTTVISQKLAQISPQ